MLRLWRDHLSLAIAPDRLVLVRGSRGLRPKLIAKDPNSIVQLFYRKDMAVGYLIIANLVASIFTLLLLWKEGSVHHRAPDWHSLGEDHLDSAQSFYGSLKELRKIP